MVLYAKIALIVLLGFYFGNIALHPADGYFLDNINLIFHEAGHTIFFFLPQFFYVLAGSAFQIFIPLFISIYFFLQKEWHSASIVLFWLGQSTINVSVYAGDAIALELPLLGGDSTMHDWNYLLSTLDILKYTSTVSHIIYSVGVGVILAALLFGISAANKNSSKVYKV